MPESKDSRQLRFLSLLRLEEAQEGGVLGQKCLDLRDSGACPILDPGLVEIVLDAM